jgi:8-oxo-dGTP pyrophosphatase MutT (NUDIX family)
MTQRRSGDTSTDPEAEVELSAGGAVVRDHEVIVIVPVQAAQREVAEETGVTADLIDKLGDVEYSYERRGRRRQKRVAFYLFTYRSGRLEDHDQEIEDARWMPLEQAVHALTYPGEREIARRALSRVSPDR